MMGFDRDDEVYVLVTPNDGTDDGVTVESDHAMVQNSLPTSPTVQVVDLRCDRGGCRGRRFSVFHHWTVYRCRWGFQITPMIGL